MFESSSNFSIDNSQFVLKCPTERPLHGIRELCNQTIHEAAHDARARDPPPQCDRELRKGEISTILSSVDEDPNPLVWVKGGAGVGKTAIAQACAEILEKRRRRFAAFFFSKEVRMNHRQFFLTVAYQLATQYPEYQVLLDTKICQDPSLLEHKTMASQFKRLIADPWEELERAGRGIRECVPIIVDALDECDGGIAQAILKIVVGTDEDKAHKFRWIFFSRPETGIEAAFSLGNVSFLHLQSAAVRDDVSAPLALPPAPTKAAFSPQRLINQTRRDPIKIQRERPMRESL
ncbi:hypothetical protein AN958_10545 [Leucoagaricus sp. SymC.cos]|nr:hypothetical protein AN958_10545 [Leucoagaricus sp. SymC.cos]